MSAFYAVYQRGHGVMTAMAKSMQKLDDLRFDGLFQPICDWPADRATRFDLVRQAAAGCGVLAATRLLMHGHDPLEGLGVLCWLWIGVAMRRRASRRGC